VVLHAHPPVGYEFVLIFAHYRWPTGAGFKPLPAHAWSLETAQAIVGSSCLIFDVAPSSSSGDDLLAFWATAWAMHPDLIPTELGCIFPEPEEPFVEREPPLFLSTSEIIHSKRETL
jgi:hypothetical protein